MSCTRADGDPADTLLTLTYGKRVDLTGHTLGLYGSGVLYEDTITGTTINEKVQVACFGFGPGFVPRDLNVRVTLTRYQTPV